MGASESRVWNGHLLGTGTHWWGVHTGPFPHLLLFHGAGEPRVLWGTSGEEQSHPCLFSQFGVLKWSWMLLSDDVAGLAFQPAARGYFLGRYYCSMRQSRSLTIQNHHPTPFRIPVFSGCRSETISCILTCFYWEKCQGKPRTHILNLNGPVPPEFSDMLQYVMVFGCSWRKICWC